MKLVTELETAWIARARAAEVDVLRVVTAPALFKPVFGQQRYADFITAMAQARRWAGQVSR